MVDKDKLKRNYFWKRQYGSLHFIVCVSSESSVCVTVCCIFILSGPSEEFPTPTRSTETLQRIMTPPYIQPSSGSRELIQHFYIP